MIDPEKLPAPKPVRLFVIGDSISIQYGPYLDRFLPAHFHYARKSDSGTERAEANLDIPIGANGGDSRMVLEYLRACREQGFIQTDILLLNCGLHDVRTNLVTGEKQVSLADYETNLQAILREIAQTDWRLIWVRCTPIIDEIHNHLEATFHRYAADVAAYNAVADRLMLAANIPTIDLHAFSENLLPDGFYDHVHFNDEARALQGAFLAGALLNR